MTARVQTTLVNSLQLAKQGDVEAIAALVNRALRSQNVQVKSVSLEGDAQQASPEGHRLYLVLESFEAPDPADVLPFLHQSLRYLAPENLQTVVIQGKAQQQPLPVWEQTIQLASAPVRIEESTEAESAENSGIPRPGDVRSPVLSNGASENSTSENSTSESSLSRRAVESRTALASVSETMELIPPTQIERAHLEGAPQVAIGNKIIYQTAQGSVVDLAPFTRQTAWRLRPRANPLDETSALPDLLGRQLETEEAIATLQSGSSVSFFGETGAGKTALLRSLARHPQIVSSFRDGVVAPQVAAKSAIEVWQTLFDLFFESEGDLPTRPTEAEMRRAFQSCRALAVLDDLDLPPAEVAQIHALPGLVILSASQERQMWGVNAMPMLGLPLNDALALVEQGLGRSLAPEEYLDAEALCGLVQGHPLRILQLTALVREEHQALAIAVQRLRIAPSADALTIKAAVSLPEAERRVLAVLVVLNGASIRAEHLGALTGLPHIQRVLATLERRYLVTAIAARYTLNPTIATALGNAWDLRPWTLRVLTYFYQWLVRQTQPEELPQPADLLPELDVLLQLMRLAIANQQWAMVLRLAQSLHPVLLLQGKWDTWQIVWQWALQAGRSLRDPGAIAIALHQLGTRSLIMDDLLTAHTHLTEALHLRESLGDRLGVTATRHNLELLLTLPTEIDPVEFSAPPPRAQERRWPQQIAIGVAGVGLAIAGMMLLLNPSSKPASFSLSSTRLGFGGQTLNTTSQSQTVRLTNTGSSPLEITSVAPAGNSKDDFQVTEDCTTAPVAPQQDCTIEITFTPQAEGDRLASVHILDRAGDNPQELLLSGIGEAPTSPFILSFAPGNVTFEPQTIGAEKMQSIMVTNTGSKPVTIDRVTVTGEQASEFQSTTTCVNATLEPKQTCRIQITFVPKALNNRRASVVIVAKGEELATGALPNQPPPFWNIPLSGTAIATAEVPTTTADSTTPGATSATAPRVSLSLSELNFGPNGIETGIEKPLVIANTGTASLYIDEMTIAGANPRDFAITENTCLGGPILADDGCIVTVRFSPSGAGDRTADLVIRDSAAAEPRRIALSGVGVEQSSSPAPTSNSPPTILSFTASPAEIAVGESVQLCYGVSHATQVSITGIGNVEPAAENCISVTPNQTTTYNLTAIGAADQTVTAQTTVQVASQPGSSSAPQPDPPQADPSQPEPPQPTPPATPQALSPGSGDRSSAPDLLSCPNSTPLTWQEGTGGSSATAFVLTLQHWSDSQEDWLTVFEERSDSGTDVTSWLTQQQSYEWRWMVRSLDAAGRSSDPSSWHYFTCYDFQ